MYALKTAIPENDKLQHKAIKSNVDSVAKSLPAVFPGKNEAHQNRSVKQLSAVHQSISPAKSLPAVKPFSYNSEQQPAGDLSLNESVLQGAFFVQPPSKDIVRDEQEIKGDAVLGGKCYAYSVFNALAQVGRTPTLEDAGADVDMTQKDVDDWIKANMGAAAGGSPQKVADKLDNTLKFMPAKLKRRTAVRTALDNNFPVSIGVAITNSAKPDADAVNHWIYAKNTTGTAIVAEDQQNTQRGDLSFTFAESKWTATSGTFTYTLTDVMIGYQGLAEKALIQEFY